MHEEDELRFLQTLWNRPVVVTYVLFAVNILIFLLMELAGGTTYEPNVLAFGAKSNYEINQGEIWRFVTPIFIHIGLLHLFFNSYALWLVGPQVEKLYGGARFLILYILSGVAGVAASYWYHPETLSAGASGAIFGLFGVLFAFVIRYRNSVPESFRRALGKGVFVTIVVNLVIGFAIPFVDNSAHVGGLVSGALLAFAIPYEKPHRLPSVVFKVAQAAMVLVVAASFYAVATHYEGSGLSLRNVGQNWLGMDSATTSFVDAINGGRTAFEESSRQASSSDPGDLAAARASLAEAIDNLSHVESIATRPDAISRSMLRLIEEQYDLLQDIERQGGLTFELTNRAEDNARRYEKLMNDLDAWVAEEGRKYGIK